MKLILIALLCSGVALGERWNWSWSSQNARVEDSAFRSGRQYKFEYNGQLSSGIAGASKQHSSNRLQAEVVIAFKSSNQAIMRFEQIRIGKMNRDIPNPRKIMPFDAFESVQIEEHLKQKLEKSVKFSYTGGLVHDVVFDGHEDAWSANIKRGVLNLLQVNLQQQRRVDAVEEARLTNNARSSRVEDDKTNFYRVMEETVEGECETLYTIQEQPGRHSVNKQVLNVTKSINFEKCNKRPQIKYNFRFGDNCPTCDSKYSEDEKFLKSSTVAKYNITGDKQAFLIESARVDSEYVFVPFNEEANAIVTYVNQTLVLRESGPIQRVQEPSNPIESDSDMIFSLDWDVAYEKFHMKGDNQLHTLMHNSQQGVNKIELAKKFVNKMASQREELDEDNLQHFVRLVQLMRLCKEEELEQIFQMQERAPEQEKKLKTIIPQALGTCGTKHCTKLLTHKIRQGQVSPVRGSFAIRSLVQNRVASQEIINELIQLAESDKARESQHLKRTSWLTVGSLINALCTNNEDQLAVESKKETSVEKLCPRDVKDKYVKTLFTKLRQASNWQDKILMLKTIGNAGLESSIFELEKIIRETDGVAPVHIRFEAIVALRELKDVVPKKIQKILMPIVMNRREAPTLRSAASYILLQTQPERSILDQLAHNLITEPSHQFAAFLWTQMNQYANSTNPCEEQLASDMTLALRHAKKINAGYGYSKMYHWSMHNEEQKVGLDLDLDTVFSNISYIPRHLGVALHANGLGFWQRYLATVNVFTEGLEPLIRQYWDNEVADMWSDSSLEQILTRHPRNTNEQRRRSEDYSNDINSIFSKLNTRPRHSESAFSRDVEPKAYLGASFKGQSVAFLPITKEIVQQMIQESGSSLRQIMQKLQQGLPVEYTTLSELHDMQYKIPTTMGMPLTVTIKAPVAWSLKGKLQLVRDSSKVYKVQAQLKPSAVAQLLCKVEAWSPIVNTGIKIKAKAKLFTPVDAKLEVDLSSKPIQIKASIKPPTEKRDLLVLESRPVSYTQDWQKYTRSTEEGHEEKTIMGEEQNRVSTFNQCYGRQSFGIQICTRGQVHRTPQRSVTGTPFTPFSGPNKIVVTAEPGQDVPEEIHFKLTTKVDKLASTDMRKPSFSHVQLDDEQGESSSSSSSELASSEQGSQERRESREQQQQQGRRVANTPINRRSLNTPAQSQRSTFNKVLQQYRNYEVKKGYKTDVRMEIEAGRSRRFEVLLTHLFDIKSRYGQLDMKVQRTRPEQYEMCLNAEMMFPQSPSFAEQVKEQKILAGAQLKWGQSCSNTQNFVKLTTRAERSGQQMEWEKRQSQYQQYRSDKCQNKAWCSPLAQEDFVEKIGHMLKYRVDIDYENVPITVQNATNKLYRALKYYYYWNTDVDQMIQNQQNKIRAEFVLDVQTKQRLNVTVKTPKETVRIQDMPLSRPIGVMNQKQSIAEQLREYVQDDDDQAECSITGKNGWTRRSQVETFDGTKFSAPFASSCWVVLAKDCGSQQQPRFVVMARKAERGANEEQKEVKIITKSHQFLLKPDTEEYESVKIEMNGRSYNPETEDNEIVSENGRSVIAKIEKDESSVQIELPKAGVEVEFDGYAINIKLSQQYRGQQCGLCGHFDLETTDEFRKPDFTEERDLRQFYMSYLVKDQCQAPQLSEVCESEECDKSEQSSSSSSSSSSGSHQNSQSNEESENTELKTKVIELDDQLCFSTVPVPQCDEEDSYPVGSKQQKKIAYVCIDQDSQSAESIERQARSGRREIAALKNRTPSFTRQENIPEKCQKYTRN
jgi:hypothetical protein